MENILVGKGPEKERFYLKELQEEDLDMAVTLCDRCVGVNLYPRKELASAIQRKNHFFYLLLTSDGEAAGYIYFFTTENRNIPNYVFRVQCNISVSILKLI